MGQTSDNPNRGGCLKCVSEKIAFPYFFANIDYDPIQLQTNNGLYFDKIIPKIPQISNNTNKKILIYCHANCVTDTKNRRCYLHDLFKGFDQAPDKRFNKILRAPL